MSAQYDEYLKEHISDVTRTYLWLSDNLRDKDYGHIFSTTSVPVHDGSKYTSEEYEAYDKYFYGKNRSYAVVNDFNKAWLHHIHNNTHHWQHWVLLEDDPKTSEPYICIEMPMNSVLETIADWWSFSWRSNNLYEIFDWYDKHKSIIKLHKNTRKLVEKILSDIKEILDSNNGGEKDDN